MPIVKTHRLSKVNMYWTCYSFLLQQVTIKILKMKKKKTKPEKEESMFALMYASEQITKINEHKARVPV